MAPGAFLVFVLAHILLLLIIMAVGRLVMVQVYAEPDMLTGHEADIWAMWRMGVLFDLRTATIALSPLYVLGLIACFSGQAAHIWAVFQKGYSLVLYFIITLAAVTSFYYYQTFHNEIDIFIFGLFNDDTQAIMINIVSDYPLLYIIPLLAGVTFLGEYITLRILRISQRLKPPSGLSLATGAAALLLFSAVYFLGMRGSIGVFPLRQNDAMVSEIPLINKAIPNGLMALTWAYNSYRRTTTYQPVSLVMGQNLALVSVGREEMIESTEENIWLAQNPPHVVLVVMESFGSNLLEFDRAGSVDLLGSFRRHLEEDFLFKRFLPEENGTMPSLAALLLSCPDHTITLSEAKYRKLENTVFDIFKKNGYETAFIYPGRGSWLNIGPYLAAQEVDNICDQNSIVTKFKPENPNLASEAGTWGLPDEYAFNFASRLLETSSKPMFIVILTISNHSPYSPPPQYRPLPIVPDAELMARLDMEEKSKLNMLYTFQYASNCVGDFIATIKNGPLGERTIIAATGDHQMRSIMAKYPVDLLLDTAVPFYLYVPKPILEHVPYRYAPERPGSHKDILPTLYALSLSDAPYYSVGGRNLMAEHDDPARAFGYNVRLFIDAYGVSTVRPPLSRYAYGDVLRLGKKLETISFPLQEEKILAFEQLRRWQINARVAGLEK